MKSIKEIFLSALDVPPDQRVDFIKEATKNSPTLRNEVKALIKAHEQIAKVFDAKDVSEFIEIFNRLADEQNEE